MIHYQSSKWQIFVSRPTSILKRDFIKWTYSSLDKISGFNLSKIVAIGNNQEMDVFVNKKEDRKNYQQIISQYCNGKIEKIFAQYKEIITNYQSAGHNLPKQCLNSMKDIGPILIYSYYVERLVDLEESKRRDELIELNGNLRDSGAKIVYPLYNCAYKFLQKKYGNKPIDSYLIKELAKLVDGREISKRKFFYIFVGTKKNTHIYTGDAAKVFLRRHGFIPAINNQARELKGLTACQGKVKGQVKIVRGLSDIKNCNGKVVICRETIIEYMPYIKKALGLVTDLGGINCHAAIATREFKIPCVVGTTFATQVFNDGDLVEVDANKGVVKKIED